VDVLAVGTLSSHVGISGNLSARDFRKLSLDVESETAEVLDVD